MDECLKRADVVDAKIEKLHQTVDEISKLLADTPAESGGGGGQALQEFKRGMLEKLRAMRVTLEDEREEASKLQAERDAAKKGVAPLQEELGKRDNRITHLLRALQQGGGGGGSPAPARDLGLRKGSCLTPSGRFQ